MNKQQESRKEILRMENICKSYPLYRGGRFLANDHVNVTLHQGETMGIVGESGSGKSTLARILMRICDADSGRILFHERDLLALRGEELRQVRRSIQMIFQDPAAAFNPKLKIREIICEPLRNFGLLSAENVDAKAREMLRLVDLPEDVADRYPNSLSGGQRQRVGIARAMILQPDIIVCDEATSALDVSVQQTIIQLLKRIQRETGVSYLFICHDLALANMFCDNILIMQKGRIVEDIRDLRHVRTNYGRHLLDSIFSVELGKRKVFDESLFA
ncbi:MAG: dipeptide/oligopeptide/nickel ABC transporter ATP-binding protein [Succiniclasticum sp.]|nr:dipeptide/oligopeptide/nickel ABC transporter ATP-binding protein [Succiniclasticum sp.]